MTNDNKCLAVGSNEYGRLGLGEIREHVVSLTPIDALNNVKVVDIECGENNCYAVSEDNNVYFWGMGNFEDIYKPTLLSDIKTNAEKLKEVSPPVAEEMGTEPTVSVISVNRFFLQAL